MIDFNEFCAKQMLGGSDKQAFKAWLGKTAKVRMSESSWLQWFARWVRERG